jgi:hypothetical protein
MFEKIKKQIRRRRPKNMKTLISREMRMSRRNIYVGTRRLEPVHEKDFHRFIVADMTDKEKWIKGVQECDAFSLHLLSNAKKWFVREYKVNAAVGMAWINKAPRGHAINFYVTPEYKIRYVEPQNDKEIFMTTNAFFVYI